LARRQSIVAENWLRIVVLIAHAFSTVLIFLASDYTNLNFFLKTVLCTFLKSKQRLKYVGKMLLALRDLPDYFKLKVP